MTPIAVQLYSLREQSQKDFVGVLRTVADIGYVGVQPAGLYGLSPQELLRIVQDLGMQIATNHGPNTRPGNIAEVVADAQALGQSMVWTGYGKDAFADVEAIERTADEVNRSIEALEREGLGLFIHNHWWEFERLADGRLKHEVLAGLCPKLQFELDVYWAANFGAEDPAAWVAKLRDRTPLLHLKDGPLERGKGHTACGAGKVDLAACVQAADPQRLKWAIVELDQCDTDMVVAVADSYRHLVGKGLAAGRKPVS